LPRTPSNRKLHFNPRYLKFGPLDQTHSGSLVLHDDELEALYLSDFKGLYQEECARSMGVSRPTFSRIIKNARKKTSEMLLLGKELAIEHRPHETVLAFATDDRMTLAEDVILAKYFALAHIQEKKVAFITFIDNPIFAEVRRKSEPPKGDGRGLGAGRIIPPLLKDAHRFVTRSIGDGLRRNIEGSGVLVTMTEQREIDEIIKRYTTEENDNKDLS
jgi:predicted DNA-binding protein (UPF0251 family)/predicted Fe-Mo cluster-binding NifX family protein